MPTARLLTGLASAICAALLVGGVGTPRAQDSPILAAMHDELARSMKELRLQDEPPPYFIEYEVEDTTTIQAAAHLGALEVDDRDIRRRSLRVGVRVGDYQFDSSRFVTRNRGDSGDDGPVFAPLDDDYDAMRRQIRIATDAAYKRAVSVFARKNAAYQNRAGAALLADFSRETPTETVRPSPSPLPATTPWPERVRAISAAFLSAPLIQSSQVSAMETRGTRYYVNSEGFRVVAPIESGSLAIVADAQADDGMELRDFYGVAEKRLDDLPPLDELVNEARRMAARLTSLRAAPVGEEYTGPVLVEAQASADVLAGAFVPMLLAERPPDYENPRGGSQRGVTPFLSRIGLRVFAEGFSVAATPSLRQFNGRPVPGAYEVDDEGVKALDVSLVENGRLITLLTGRTPQRNLPQSKGHGRVDGVQAGVIQVQSAQALPASELRQRYLDLLDVQDKPFGYIVRRIDSQTLIDVVRVTPAGVEEPVRGLRFGGIPPSAFRDVLEASEERTMISHRAGGNITISVIAPALLFEELEIQPSRDILQRPPVVASPLTTN